MQSRTSLRTASLLVSTARNPLVNNWVKLFSKVSSLDMSGLGEFWPSSEDRVVFTAKFGVDRNVTLLWVGGVCGFDIGLLIFLEEIEWICVVFVLNSELEWIRLEFELEIVLGWI